MTLEEQLPGLFDELANAHTVGNLPELGDDLTSMTALGVPRRSRAFVSLAAAACIALGIGGLVILSGRNGNQTVSDQPTATTSATPPDSTPPITSRLPNSPGVAVVLAPPSDSDIRLISVQDWGTSGTASGAVVAPDGTVFSIHVGSGPTWLPDTADWETIPSDRRALDTIAGRAVAAVVDGSAPSQIYRTIRDECWSIEIVTADIPIWNENVTTLIEAIAPNRDVHPVDEAAVTVDVPDDWTSLGAERMLQSWTMELQVDIDGIKHDVHLLQRPNSPVGVLVSGESNPVPFEHNGQQWWAVDIVTTPGMTSVIGNSGLGAFHITSDLSAAQLVAIIEALTPTSTDSLSDTTGATRETVAVAVTEFSAATATAGTSLPGTQCGALGTGLDFIDS